MTIMQIISNVMLLAVIVTVLSEYLSKVTKFGGFWAQLQSWIVAIFVAVFANVLGFGFESITWFTSIVYGIFVGLVANGFFEIPWVKNFLAVIKARYIA